MLFFSSDLCVKASMFVSVILCICSYTLFFMYTHNCDAGCMQVTEDFFVILLLNDVVQIKCDTFQRNVHNCIKEQVKNSILLPHNQREITTSTSILVYING